MNYLALFSGGKDSTFAIFKEKDNVNQLLSFLPKDKDSYMFHYPNIEFTKVQAERMGLPIKVVETSCEDEIGDMEKAIKEVKVDGIVSGAIASQYQKQRIDRICEKLRLKSIAPLWHVDQEKYMEEIVERKFKFMITSVSAEGLDESWLGKVVDEKALEELIEIQKKNKINLSGEGGEYCTFVVNCPLFSKEIKIKKAEKQWFGNYGFYLIKETY